MSVLPIETLEKLASSPPSAQRQPVRQPTRQDEILKGKDGAPGKPRITPMIEGCAFMRHWAVNAASLSEPEWKAGIDLAARCEDGPAMIHEYSKRYPNYSHEETEDKIQRSLIGPPPRTCVNIATEIGFSGCQACPFYRE